DLLADRRYRQFKCISQFNFPPLEIPPTPEQRRYEIAQRRHEKSGRLALSNRLAVKIRRRLGGEPTNCIEVRHPLQTPGTPAKWTVTLRRLSPCVHRLVLLRERLFLAGC